MKTREEQDHFWSSWQLLLRESKSDTSLSCWNLAACMDASVPQSDYYCIALAAIATAFSSAANRWHQLPTYSWWIEFFKLPDKLSFVIQQTLASFWI